MDQQSDCWSTEAFGSDSETHSEDGSNIQRLAGNYTAASTLNINDPLGRFNQILTFRFHISSPIVPAFSMNANSATPMEELIRQQNRLTISTEPKYEPRS